MVHKNEALEHSSATNSEENDNSELKRIHSAYLEQYGPNWNLHSLSTMKRQTVSRVLYLDRLYKKIVNTTGVICEFGVQWGAGIATLMSLRGIYEPYNHSREIIGFDTFAGFVNSTKEYDGAVSEDGDYSVSSEYEKDLERILGIHERNAPLSHIKKFSLVKGDASETVPKWLEANPHAIVSMAIFDMDIYKPTRDVLTAIMPRLTRGSLLVFDELNCKAFPGETTAVQEVIGLNNLRLERDPHMPNCAWAEFV